MLSQNHALLYLFAVPFIALAMWLHQRFVEPRYAIRDVSKIKDVYEAYGGPAGPNARVLSAERSGDFSLGVRSPTWRKYDVSVERYTGEQAALHVGVCGGSVVEIRGSGSVRYLNANR